MLFEHIYAYLLDDTYQYPKQFKSELDYYQIGEPKEPVCTPCDSSNECNLGTQRTYATPTIIRKSSCVSYNPSRCSYSSFNSCRAGRCPPDNN